MNLRPWALALGCVLLTAGAAHATAHPDWDLDELALRADLIVVGTVQKKDYFVDEKRRAVITESTISVERTLMGKAQPAFVLTQIGGRAGSVRTRVRGDAELDAGDRVLLFTFENEDKRRYLVGMALGAWFSLEDEPPSERGEERFGQHIGAPLFDVTGSLLPPPGDREVQVDDVRSSVEKVAKAGYPALSRGLDQPLPLPGASPILPVAPPIASPTASPKSPTEPSDAAKPPTSP